MGHGYIYWLGTLEGDKIKNTTSNTVNTASNTMNTASNTANTESQNTALEYVRHDCEGTTHVLMHICGFVIGLRQQYTTIQQQYSGRDSYDGVTIQRIQQCSQPSDREQPCLPTELQAVP